MPTILVVGASGVMGGLIAREAVRRDLNVVLAGRHPDRLVDLAATFRSGRARAAMVDVTDARTLDSALSAVDLVLNTAGPFTRLAAPVIDACLRARIPYVDLANELPAVQALLDRDGEARQHSVALVTGAGFGVVATETLALLLARSAPDALESVQVAAAPAVAFGSPGVQTSIAEALSQGSARFVDGQLVYGPLGEGSTTLELLDGPRRVLPAPTGDLVAAQRATAAPNVVAYAPIPSERPAPTTATQPLRSFAWAAGSTRDGRTSHARLTFGEGFQASASIAVEVAVRLLAAPRPGAWTPGALFGAPLALACGADVQGPEPWRS